MAPVSKALLNATEGHRAWDDNVFRRSMGRTDAATAAIACGDEDKDEGSLEDWVGFGDRVSLCKKGTESSDHS